MRILCNCYEYDKLISLIDQIKKYNYSEFDFKYLFVNNESNDRSLDLIKDSKLDFLNLKKNKV